MGLTVKWVPLIKQYNLCCCSSTLKTGTIIIGWFGLLSEMLQALDAGVRLNYYGEEKHSHTEEHFLLPPASRDVLITRLTTGLLHALVNGLLLFGAWKEIPGFMLPYVLMQFIVIILAALLITILSIILVFFDPFLAVLLLLIGEALSMFSAYLWVGVYTYYRQLEDRILAQQNSQIHTFAYTKSTEEEKMLHPGNMQKSYAQIEYNVNKDHPQAV